MSIRDLAASVAIAEKLYQARNTVLNLMGKDKFIERVDAFRPIMLTMCEKKNISKMEATIEILSALKGKGIESTLAMAACVEIMEPTEAMGEK